MQVQYGGLVKQLSVKFSPELLCISDQIELAQDILQKRLLETEPKMQQELRDSLINWLKELIVMVEDPIK